MDYQGNYFPEEHDENESKAYRYVKGAFKWTMYGISFVLYAVIIYLLFSNSDSDILETNYMGDLPQFKNVEKDDIELYRINTTTFMDEDGSMQLYSIDYSDEYGIIEIGVKYNAKKLTNSEYGDPLNFVLTDSNGNKYKLVKKIIDSNGRYGFYRISFEGFDIDLDINDLRYNSYVTNAFTPAFADKSFSNKRDSTSYRLAIYRKSDGKLLSDFELYNNSVTFSKTDYQD